jgi:hypothetical protein
LIWSPRSEDSDWCKREYDAFVTKESAGGFRSVIARLGDAVLPLWAQTKLWVDFSDDREGPRYKSRRQSVPLNRLCAALLRRRKSVPVLVSRLDAVDRH